MTNLIPTEKDLDPNNSSDERFSQAILCCKGYPPDCIFNGSCMFGGCFDIPQMSEREMKQLIEKQKQELDDLKCRQTRLIAAIDGQITALNQHYKRAVKNNNEKLVWGYHYARQQFLDLKRELTDESKN